MTKSLRTLTVLDLQRFLKLLINEQPSVPIEEEKTGAQEAAQTVEHPQEPTEQEQPTQPEEPQIIPETR
ncbi:hypothetical protein GE061_002537 [Apolygus lucorum]|uniref:Uncharacterized protein n=1 Tax=Apolygus lucorum TaxID=248454 RepID=A0A8S9X5E5_APOLU|nr:hypothetical protein GE061_002537 [Apolygus lucorum]